MTERIAEKNGEGQSMWLFSALLSALFMALTAVLAKVGVNGVNGTLTTTTHTAVILAMIRDMAFLMHTGQGTSAINQRSWLFFILSGLATGASWSCYYRTLQLGHVNQIMPVSKFSIVFIIFFAVLFLREELAPRSALDCVLTTFGTALMALWPWGAKKRQTENYR